VSWDFTTVRQQSVAVTPDATGKGTSRALRWRNEQPFPVNGEFLRVRSTQCGTDCGPDDVYRVRSFDTTCAVPRFNNVTGQATVLLLQNASAMAFSGTIDFWDATGALRASVPFALAPRGTLVHNTALTVPDLSGSITIMHEGGYGDLSGKAVSIEPATGFTFDTPLVPRPR
jgi:hypothetical protein